MIITIIFIIIQVVYEDRGIPQFTSRTSFSQTTIGIQR